MDLSEIKKLIQTYFTAGQPQTAVADILNHLNLNGCMNDALEYMHSIYAVKDTYYARNLTDTGNAERFVNTFGDLLRYCYERNKWLIWNGDVWEWDNGSQVMNLAKEVARNIYAEASKEDDDKQRERIAKHAHNSESESRRKAMLNLAQSEIGIPVDIQDIDNNHWLFNCANGTINLRTGELLPHNSHDMLSIINPIEYHPNAKCERWMEFLNRVLDGKKELMRYVQKAVGYSLTGDIKEQCLFFCYGLGRNGKSTFVGIIRKMLGAYGCQTQTELFMTKERGGGVGPNESLADLQGMRFVVGSEIEDGRRLAVVLIKEMTGGEAIRTERKYEHSFEFQPTHKIWLSGNHKPIITDTTFSIWRRVKLIPFTVTIPDNECDPELSNRLEKELPGILAWAVQGCLLWQKEGLGEPQEVKAATEAYRVEQDVLGEFIEDCCILISTGTVAKNTLQKTYTDWCTENNQPQLKQREFRGKLIERGVIDGRGTGGIRLWRGITLRENPVEQGELVTRVTTETGIAQKFPIKNLVKTSFSENPVTSVTNVTNVTHEQTENTPNIDDILQKKEDEPF